MILKKTSNLHISGQSNLLRRRGFILGTLIVLCYVLVFYEIYLTHTFTSTVQYHYYYENVTIEDPSAIHICMILRGKKTVNRGITMLKSILYYQGRMNGHGDNCRLQHLMRSERLCQGALTPRYRPLKFHIIGDSDARNTTRFYFERLSLSSFKWYLYNIEDYLPKFSHVPTLHAAGSTPLLKLMIPEILPANVLKAIVIDSDLLFNDNIVDLWDHFDRFDEDQAYGCAWEQRGFYRDCKDAPSPPLPWHGLNSGVQLMDLVKMRQMYWHSLWRNAAGSFLRWRLVLGQTHQDILNSIIRHYPRILYRLPCEWNVQLCYPPQPNCCPVVWYTKLANEADCVSRPGEYGSEIRPNMAKIIHFNTHPKPEGEAWDNSSEFPKIRINSSYTTQEMKSQFFVVYESFKAVPLSCFT
ncbi:unnamed protein product [Calicophoron daubneyi]|uniref:Glycosyltransferase n=1 Tax=Calicophoron daubneyi TaxID=300641 RepID=A0AAV2TG86_CALDB